MRDESRLRELRQEAAELRELIRRVEEARAMGAEISLQVLYAYGRAIARLPLLERAIAELEGEAAWGG